MSHGFQFGVQCNSGYAKLKFEGEDVRVTRVIAVPEVMVDNEVLLAVGGRYEVAKEGKEVCQIEVKGHRNVMVLPYTGTITEEAQPSSGKAEPIDISDDDEQTKSEKATTDEPDWKKPDATDEPDAKKPKTT